MKLSLLEEIIVFHGVKFRMILLEISQWGIFDYNTFISYFNCCITNLRCTDPLGKVVTARNEVSQTLIRQ